MREKEIARYSSVSWASLGGRVGLVAGLTLALASGSGCTHYYAVQSGQVVQGAPADTQQGPAAPAYAVPDGAPEGVVYVMNLGLDRFEGATPGAYLHLRIAAQNDRGVAPWTIEAREQAVIYAGQEVRIPASFAEGSGATSPLRLTAGQRGHVDLWFPITVGADPERVSLHWRLRRGGAELIAERQTIFERAQHSGSQTVYYRPVPYSHVHLTFGPGWWWGPYYGWGWGAYAGFWDPYWGWGYGPWGWPYWGGYWGVYRRGGVWIGGTGVSPGIRGGFGGGSARAAPMGGGALGGGGGGRGISRGFGRR